MNTYPMPSQRLRRIRDARKMTVEQLPIALNAAKQSVLCLERCLTHPDVPVPIKQEWRDELTKEQHRVERIEAEIATRTTT